jgi:hypothetical protein
MFLPMSNCICYNKEAGYNVYYNPESLEPQGYSSFSQSQNGHIGTIMIIFAHKVASGSVPYFF